jgi:predicted phosphodiesterase
MKSLIVSNIQGNWPALQAVLAAEPDAEQILCLGDLIGHGPQPAECVAWAMQLNPPSRVVAAPISSGAGDCTPEMEQFLADLKPFQQFDWDGSKCFACQRVARQPLDRADFARLESKYWNATELTRMDTDLILTGVPGKLFVLVGHPDFLFLADACHALQTELNGTVIVNPGSVGLPDDDDACAAYAVWENGQVALRRVAYDLEATIHAHERLDFAELATAR